MNKQKQSHNTHREEVAKLPPANFAQARLAAKLRAQGVKESGGKKDAWTNKHYIEGMNEFMKLFGKRKVRTGHYDYVVETTYDNGQWLGYKGWWTYIHTRDGDQICPAVHSPNKVSASVAHGWAIIKADERSSKISDIEVGLRACGYEQLQSNDKGLTDYDEALQLLCEDALGDACPISMSGKQVSDFMLKLLKSEERVLEEGFKQEFMSYQSFKKAERKVSKRETRSRVVPAVEAKVIAVPGTPTFWQDLKAQYNLK